MPIFLTVFSQDVRSVRAERLHGQVEVYLDDLRIAGHSVPAPNGKNVCMQWVRHQWLYREPGDNGQERYRLTSHTQDALNIVDEIPGRCGRGALPASGRQRSRRGAAHRRRVWPRASAHADVRIP